MTLINTHFTQVHVLKISENDLNRHDDLSVTSSVPERTVDDVTGKTADSLRLRSKRARFLFKNNPVLSLMIFEIQSRSNSQV